MPLDFALVGPPPSGWCTGDTTEQSGGRWTIDTYGTTMLSSVPSTPHPYQLPLGTCYPCWNAPPFSPRAPVFSDTASGGAPLTFRGPTSASSQPAAGQWDEGGKKKKVQALRSLPFFPLAQPTARNSCLSPRGAAPQACSFLPNNHPLPSSLLTALLSPLPQTLHARIPDFSWDSIVRPSKTHLSPFFPSALSLAPPSLLRATRPIPSAAYRRIAVTPSSLAHPLRTRKPSRVCSSRNKPQPLSPSSLLSPARQRQPEICRIIRAASRSPSPAWASTYLSPTPLGLHPRAPPDKPCRLRHHFLPTLVRTRPSPTPASASRDLTRPTRPSSRRRRLRLRRLPAWKPLAPPRGPRLSWRASTTPLSRRPSSSCSRQRTGRI